MKNTSFSCLVSSLLVVCYLLIPNLVFAHSGGTDANGCHSGSQPYHCHNSGSTSLPDINHDTSPETCDSDEILVDGICKWGSSYCSSIYGYGNGISFNESNWGQVLN